MKRFTSKLIALLKGFSQENGQDLVEYALVVALIAFATVSGVKSLATKLNTSYANISSVLTSNIN